MYPPGIICDQKKPAGYFKPWKYSASKFLPGVSQTARASGSLLRRPLQRPWKKSSPMRARFTCSPGFAPRWRCTFPGIFPKESTDLSQTIRQIVAWFLSDTMLGGFHFNGRRYPDDDLTRWSIDPYQVFRIFHEVLYFEWDTGKHPDVAYMIDQSHNLKGKIEAMIQKVTRAQQLYSKAVLVDNEKLAGAQNNADLLGAESLLQVAFATDVRPAIREWPASKGLPTDPLNAFRESGYLECITKERAARNSRSVFTYA
jgi:hypothetical protein